jgi:hypothetical protein
MTLFGDDGGFFSEAKSGGRRSIHVRYTGGNLPEVPEVITAASLLNTKNRDRDPLCLSEDSPTFWMILMRI